MKRTHISKVSDKMKGILSGISCFVLLECITYGLLEVAHNRYINIWHIVRFDFLTQLVITFSVLLISSILLGLSIAIRSKPLKILSYILLLCVIAFFIQGIIYMAFNSYF